MGRQDAPGDLLAGGAAAAVLVVLVFVLRLNPILAVLLSLAVFGGLSLLSLAGAALPRSRRRRRWQGPFGGSGGANRDEIADQASDEAAYEAARLDAAAIGALAAQVANPATRAQLDRILERTGQILAAMRADEDVTEAPVLDSLILEPLRALLTTYVRISARDIRGAKDLLVKIEDVDLPRIEQAVTEFYERLHQRQVIDLATLSDMLEINLESARATMRRRKTP